jgi:REP element-mobilizing transposase RayT
MQPAVAPAARDQQTLTLLTGSTVVRAMAFDRKRRHRRSIRLPTHDYTAPGGYFVTVCTYERVCLFGDVIEDKMRLNDTGKIVRDEWMRSAAIRREIVLDEFVVMPNHVHGIVMIRESVGATGRSPLHGAPRSPLVRSGPPPRSLGSFVGGFKSAVATHVSALRGTRGVTIWQRNYYEHVIRDDSERERIREYIRQNPLRWAIDRENPKATVHDLLEPWEPQAR